MKLYIVGAVGSGKSTLARRLSKQLRIPCTELDCLVHRTDDESSMGNTRRTEQERDHLFNALLAHDDWIMEDIGRGCFEEGLRQADVIVWLDPPRLLREARLLIRYGKQQIGLEKCLYRPSLLMLKDMFRWSRAYASGADGCRQRYQRYGDKLVRLRTNRQLEHLLRRCCLIAPVIEQK